MLPNLSNYAGGHPLQVSAQFQLRAALFFYDHALILQKPEDKGGMSEFAVNPETVARLLSTKVEFNTGLLSGDTLYVGQVGASRIILEYRKPQMTGLWLDGLETALRIPLPGLVLKRVTQEDTNPQYSLFAVKDRPTSPEDRLYHAPLPNTSSTGVCWGSVTRPSKEEMMGTVLTRDWEQLLGSRFNNHQAGGKSKRFDKDIRLMYHWLVEGDKKTYPKRDLRESGYTFGYLMGEKQRVY